MNAKNYNNNVKIAEEKSNEKCIAVFGRAGSAGMFKKSSIVI
jgi:hypothetical protein